MGNGDGLKSKAMQNPFISLSDSVCRGGLPLKTPTDLFEQPVQNKRLSDAVVGGIGNGIHRQKVFGAMVAERVERGEQ